MTYISFFQGNYHQDIFDWTYLLNMYACIFCFNFDALAQGSDFESKETSCLPLESINDVVMQNYKCHVQIPIFQSVFHRKIAFPYIEMEMFLLSTHSCTR